MTELQGFQAIIEDTKAESWEATNNPRTPGPLTDKTDRSLNMSLPQKVKPKQIRASGTGFCVNSVSNRHYIKIAQWSLQNEFVQTVLKDDRLSRHAKATYAFVAWYCHKNNTNLFSEKSITSRHKQIFKLLDAMESVLGHSLEEVA